MVVCLVLNEVGTFFKFSWSAYKGPQALLIWRGPEIVCRDSCRYMWRWENASALPKNGDGEATDASGVTTLVQVLIFPTF